MIGPASARLLYEVMHNEWEHEKGISGIEWREGVLSVEEEYILLQHTKEIYFDEAITMGQKIIKAENAIMGKGDLDREGIPLMIDLIDFLEGSAKWIFYEDGSSEQNICEEYKGITLTAPKIIIEGEGMSYMEAASTKVTWKLSLEFPTMT